MVVLGADATCQKSGAGLAGAAVRRGDAAADAPSGAAAAAAAVIGIIHYSISFNKL